MKRKVRSAKTGVAAALACALSAAAAAGQVPAPIRDQPARGQPQQTYARPAPPVYMPPGYASRRPPAPPPAPDSNFEARPWAIFGHFSGWGPFGVLAVSLDRSITKWGGVEAGCGFSGSFQAAVMGRFRIPITHRVGFGVGAGPSLSPDWSLACVGCNAAEQRAQDRWRVAYFFNTEAFAESRANNGFSFRFYFGFWHLLNQTPDECTGPCDKHDTTLAPYFGVAFGGAF